jgi:RNA polymerase sigma-70 factor (ECF subfamily)
VTVRHGLQSPTPPKRLCRGAATTDDDDLDGEFTERTLPYLDAVWNVARRMAPDPASAEDLVQETYLLAYRGFASKRDGDMRSWLVSICLNAARSEHRRRGRRPIEELGAAPDLAHTSHGPDQVALANLDREAVNRALNTLPEVQRTAVILADLAGLTASEIARACDVPRGTVLARVHRGRRRLAETLTKEGAVGAL